MTANDKKDIMDIVDLRMREVASMISSIEKSFTDLKSYLEKLIDQQNAETTRLRNTTVDLYEKRTELIEKVSAIDTRVTSIENAITTLKEKQKDDIADIHVTLDKAVDNKRFMWTQVISGLGLVIMVILYVLDKVPKGS